MVDSSLNLQSCNRHTPMWEVNLIETINDLLKHILQVEYSRDHRPWHCLMNLVLNSCFYFAIGIPAIAGIAGTGGEVMLGRNRWVGCD